MRGKEQGARRRREGARTAAAVERLRIELDAEARKAKTARERATQVKTARARLAYETQRSDERLGPLTEQARLLAASVGPGSAAITAALTDLRAAGEKLSVDGCHLSVDEISRAGFRMRLPGVHRSAGASYRRAWYQKRMHRPLDVTREVTLHGWVPPETPDFREALAPYATCTVRDATPQAHYTWAIPPWMRPPSDTSDAPTLRRRLGATIAGTPLMPRDPASCVPLRRDATISTPWRHAPEIGEPADAADLSYWYARSVQTQGWGPDSDPVPFWLPAEHSVSYPKARPLPDGTQLRLPYPVTFVAFAAPWHIKPSPADEPAPNDAIRALTLYARGPAAKGQADELHVVLSRLHATGHVDRSELPTPLQALDHYGGLVEGLIFTAGADGTPNDDFAWCIAISHPSGLPLGRIAVPGSREKTVWHQQINNVLAGVALSCWHEPFGPDTRATVSSDIARNLDDNTPEITVGILDIEATSPTTSWQPSDRPGRTPRAHLRRGHWRRQHVGPEGGDTRWTWVRPTTVGGSRISTRQIYVLPAPSVPRAP